MRREEKIFETYLKQVGLFLTKERLAILNAVFSWHHHFDVDRIYDHFVQKGMVLSKATIYRTLPLLLEANLIKKLFPHPPKRFMSTLLGILNTFILFVAGVVRFMKKSYKR